MATAKKEPREILVYHPGSDCYVLASKKEFGEMANSEDVDDVSDVPKHTMRAAIQGLWIGNGILPEDLCKQGTEHGEQCALFHWAAVMANVGIAPQLKAMFAVPNGGERGIASASQIKAEGAMPGVPDVFLAAMQVHGGQVYGGLFIEMKRANGRMSDLSDKQVEWKNRLRENGYAIDTCFGWKHAAKTICEYLAIDVDNPKVYPLE